MLRALVKITFSFVTILMAKLNIDFRTSQISVTRVDAATLALRLSQIYNNLSHNTGTKLKVISTKTLNMREDAIGVRVDSSIIILEGRDYIYKLGQEEVSVTSGFYLENGEIYHNYLENLKDHSKIERKILINKGGENGIDEH